MRELSLTVAVSLITASPALAAPVKIDCVFKTGMSEDWPVQFLADPETSQVTINDGLLPSRNATVRASFRPETVIFSQIGFVYEINRTTLETRRMSISTSEQKEQKVTCKLGEMTKRAF
jgi:hypothetical protein